MVACAGGYLPRAGHQRCTSLVTGFGNSSMLWSVDYERSLPFSSVRTQFAQWYQPGPFAVVLPNRGADEAWRQINYLIDHAYIDQHTRAVMFQFTVFNPMMHRFCSFVLVAELQPTGGVLPTGNFEVRMRTCVGTIACFGCR